MNPNARVEALEKMRKGALLVGLIGTPLCLLGYFLGPKTFLVSYLVTFLFWCGILVGTLSVLMIHNLTGGGWGYPIRRVLGSVFPLLPGLVLLFLPIAFGMKELYGWADPHHIAGDPMMVQKQAYLNVPFFLGRSAFYFTVWMGLAFGLTHRPGKSRLLATDRGAENGFGMILYALTVTFSAIDWAMSLEPHWNSTIYGMLFMVGHTLSGFSLVTLTALLLSNYEPFTRTLTVSRARDLGTLLFVFVILWAYVSLAQFIIIWSGNLVEKVPWYTTRLKGGWNWIAVFLVFFDFVVPFFLLLMRAIKKNMRLLRLIVGWIMLTRWISLIWIIKPAFYDRLHIHWLDFAILITVSAWFLSFFCLILSKRSLISLEDPLAQAGETQ